MDYKGRQYLRTKLNLHRDKVLKKYEYYNEANIPRDETRGEHIPPKMRHLQVHNGWCRKAVDTLVARLQFNRFSSDFLSIGNVYKLNSQDILVNNAIKDAVIAGVSFLYIRDLDGFPAIQVISAGDATGIYDESSGFLTEGLAVLERDPDTLQPITEAYFLPNRTEIYTRGQAEPVVYTHSSPYPALVPMIYNPSATTPFGASKISKAARQIQDAGMNCIKRSIVASSYYSVPQRYILGLDPDAEFDRWQTSMNAVITLSSGEDAGKIDIGSFTQQSFEPFLKEYENYATMFAAETNLSVDDLAIQSGGSQNSEALKSSRENMRLDAMRAQSSFSVALLNTGLVAACMRDRTAYSREILADYKVLWKSCFEISPQSLSSLGDSIYKINQALGYEYFDKDKLDELLGV